MFYLSVSAERQPRIMQNRIRLVIADDNLLIRSSVRAFLQTTPHIQIVAEATTGDEACIQCHQHHPDVLLLDIEMPGMRTAAIVSAVRTLTPPVKVLIFSAYEDMTTIRVLLDAGIVGYLLKDEAVEDLAHAIEAVAEGGTWFSPSIARHIATIRATQKRYNTADIHAKD